MSEWLKEHAWKACVGETLPWVRIPLSPPIHKQLNTKDLSHSRCSTESGPIWRSALLLAFWHEIRRQLSTSIAPSHTGRLKRQEKLAGLRRTARHPFIVSRKEWIAWLYRVSESSFAMLNDRVSQSPATSAPRAVLHRTLRGRAASRPSVSSSPSKSTMRGCSSSDAGITTSNWRHARSPGRLASRS